jgi:2-polyprenyl-3-methyl-5-hydroxy-6-metoxy-1,4-benzoquinol methylase
VILDIPDLRIFPDPYIDIDEDRAKGLQVAARFNELTFSELVDFYYSITSVVPPRDARQYKRGLMAGAARTEASLALWENSVNGKSDFRSGNVLEVGCGTGPLIVSAASQYAKIVGVDIAFRWLVVAKKRLAEANLDVPLICACAEALPFRTGVFDRVIADSVLEHLSDQSEGLAEISRVMCPGGYLFVSSPNKFSLGPDPQVGIWGGGFLPMSWIAAYVRRNGGIPPKRHLLSAQALCKLIKETGFRSPRIALPPVPTGQRSHFGKGLRLLIDLYHLALRFPVSRQLLYWVGPLLHAVAEKPKRSLEREYTPTTGVLKGALENAGAFSDKHEDRENRHAF